jgi:hypothetical protein
VDDFPEGRNVLTLQNVLKAVNERLNKDKLIFSSSTNIPYVHLYCEELELQSLDALKTANIRWLRIIASTIRVAQPRDESITVTVQLP